MIPSTNKLSAMSAMLNLLKNPTYIVIKNTNMPMINKFSLKNVNTARKFSPTSII